MEEKLVDMQSELATIKSQMHTLLSYISLGHTPEDLIIMDVSLCI